MCNAAKMFFSIEFSTFQINLILKNKIRIFTTAAYKKKKSSPIFQAILCRAMLPCQDTPSVKATYSANIYAKEGITVLMSAIR